MATERKERPGKLEKFW